MLYSMLRTGCCAMSSWHFMLHTLFSLLTAYYCVFTFSSGECAKNFWPTLDLTLHTLRSILYWLLYYFAQCITLITLLLHAVYYTPSSSCAYSLGCSVMRSVLEVAVACPGNVVLSTHSIRHTSYFTLHTPHSHHSLPLCTAHFVLRTARLTLHTPPPLHSAVW